MKRISIIKRIFVIALIFLLSINTLAAAVSDNDGASFISKSEFDTLRSQFQSQIDGYTTTIDAKIENAITGYISGIPTKKEYYLSRNDSMITYPLKIYNTEFKWTLANWQETSADTNGDGIWQRYDTRWWAPNTDFWSSYNYCNEPYDFVQLVLKLKHVRDDLNQITSFYNGVANTTTGIFKIKNRWDNVSCTNICAAMDDVKGRGWSLGAAQWISVRHDLKKLKKFDNATDTAFDTRRTDGSALCSTKNNILTEPIEADNYVRRYIYTAYPGGAPKFVDDGVYGRLGRYQGPGNWNNNELAYDTYKVINNDDVRLTKTEVNKIETIYNYANDANLLPVANNEQVYYTNKIDLKQDIYNDYKNDVAHLPILYAMRWFSGEETVAKGEVPTWMGFVDTGFCIEPEGWASSAHTWDKRALIKIDRARYEVTGAVDKKVQDMKLTDGIFLTQIPYESESCEIKINVTNESSANQRYVVVSKKSISLHDIVSAGTNPDLYTLYSAKAGVTGSKYKTITNGENKIYLKNLDPGSNIYFKIFWADNDKTYTQLNSAPEVTIETVN